MKTNLITTVLKYDPADISMDMEFLDIWIAQSSKEFCIQTKIRMPNGSQTTLKASIPMKDILTILDEYVTKKALLRGKKNPHNTF